eukprot:PLAT12526.5.p2 GENE.PLAT12526.5~~PLAT12526.5.p2  ORF type:complete len:422 (+),score=231.27 PLAT12526.5:1739-3004(+)
MAAASATTKKLEPFLTISDNPSEVFVVRFSPDGSLLAAGCGDGSIRVFSTTTGRLTYSLNVGTLHNLPTCALRFRPYSAASKTKNVLLAVNADGTVQHWHVASGQMLHSVEEEDNQLFCVDYRRDAALFATAGKDYKVRIYDEATKTLVSTMDHGSALSGTPGHSNRVFSLHFHPSDDNIVVSGGWDNTVQVWDLRMEASVRSIFGPHVCGDSVAVHDDVMLTGSWRPDEALELWDFGTGKRMEVIDWHGSRLRREPCLLYAADFSNNNDAAFFAAGGSGSNEAKVFDRSAGNALIGTVAGMSRAVFSVDFSPDSSMLAVGGGDASIRLLNIVDAAEGDDVLREVTDTGTTVPVRRGKKTRTSAPVPAPRRAPAPRRPSDASSEAGETAVAPVGVRRSVEESKWDGAEESKWSGAEESKGD